jgi:hypothetical protein
MPPPAKSIQPSSACVREEFLVVSVLSEQIRDDEIDHSEFSFLVR